MSIFVKKSCNLPINGKDKDTHKVDFLIGT